MAISPPSDIVLDVARAVDATEMAAAREKLNSLAGSIADFTVSTAADLRASLADVDKTTGARPEAFRKFEGMVLQSFLQHMLPTDAGEAYGKGLSGEMWKGLLAQELAGVMAERGGIGIAERVMGDYYMENDRRVALAGVNGNPLEQAEADTQSLLSVALIQEIQRTIVRSFDSDVPPLSGEAVSGR
ncbi:rod-binding protein [Nitratireductor mangrovi]|nr:rod-binding protein [Nitratireductor mangrovi]